MRADRLVATLMLMQTRGRVTAAELADELEISVATARRDLEALSAAGVPVYPQPGRGGGWQLVGGARTDLSGLTADEARSLFLLLGPAAATPEVRSALRKLLRALPATFRAEASAAAAAVVVDPAGWGEPERPRPPLVDLLQSAVVRRARVSLTYGSGQDPRLVEPWGLVGKGELWYLIAGTERGRRTFRVDRIAAAEPTAQTFTPPEDFDLNAAWQEVVEVVEQKQTETSATVLVSPRHVRVLRDQFGRHCHVLEERDGRTLVRLTAPRPIMIAQHLAGWGALLEVVDSPEVEAELARLGSELVARYGSPAAAQP
ncbi:helix-turn-helix transcriptional regulator [Nonomuraea soli]|uniref:Putative DNA-binding transcriptional regulator YafY n=1 Tax=Nonomuraea soli TaxID=1032476 RepID=A0A7W0CFU5_9ACTN|nr:WYL domain-containing protein [Nonomuraea soli]MBA2890404.1 putative DNA-binding transcriptional regulator YafY [Nonomuraea soli]